MYTYVITDKVRVRLAIGVWSIDKKNIFIKKETKLPLTVRTIAVKQS